MGKVFCILGIIVSLFLTLLSDGMSLSGLYIPFAIFTLFVAFISYKKDSNASLQKFWLRPSIISFFSLVIVGFQLSIDDVLGNSSIDTTLFSGASAYADFCFFSAGIFIYSYLLGLEYKTNIIFKQKETIIKKKQAIAWLVLMIVSFVSFVSTIDVYFFLSGAAYQGSGDADYVFTISNTLEGLYQAFFYITLGCYSKLIGMGTNEPSKSFWRFLRGFPIVFWICVILYLILRLLSGDRGPVIYNSLAIIYAYIWCSKYKFKLSIVVVSLILGAMFVSFLGTFRSRDSDLSIAMKIYESIDRNKEHEGKSIFGPTVDLAESEDTHFMAVRDIAQNRTSYSLGRFTLLSITSAIPGLKRKYLYDLGLTPGEIDSAVYFSISSQGKNYSFGEGSSMFGEAYLEFGLIGMILFGLLLGFIYKQVDISLMQNRSFSVISLAIILKLSAQAIYMGRTSFAIELGSVLHLIVLYLIFNFAIKRLS